MARAHYIWLVEYASDNRTFAAFTVKHEMITFLKRLSPNEDYHIKRYYDGGGFGTYEFYLPEDFLGEIE